MSVSPSTNDNGFYTHGNMKYGARFSGVNIGPTTYPISKREVNGLFADVDDHWASTRKTLKWSTLISLGITGSLGTIVAVNRPTLLGEGRCVTGNPVFGDFGCGELSTVHGMSAAVSMVLYTASEVLNLTTAPVQRHSSTHRIFKGVHRIGMIALPVAGIIARFPGVLGIDGNSANFSKTLRTIHMGTGYVTALAYTITFSIN